MAAALAWCGMALWRRRSETGDNSRTIQAIFSWISAFSAVMFISRIWVGTQAPGIDYFNPNDIFPAILFQIAFFLYPLEVIKPIVNRLKVIVLLFAPMLALFVVGTGTGINYTSIFNISELWDHLGEFNVWFRLLTLVVMLFYGFTLLLVPFDWRESNADRKFILNYALGFCLIGVLFFAIQLSHNPVFMLMHQVVWAVFFVMVARYELYIRIPHVAATVDLAVPVRKEAMGSDQLWHKISQILEENDGWRNPDLTLSVLTSQVFSNRTYVSEAFKKNTGMHFSEYLSKRRINYITGVLKDQPASNIQDLFFYVGFRSLSTARENFKKVTGVSPTDFVNGLM